MSWRAHLLLFLLLLPLFNGLAVLALPTLVNFVVMQRIAGQAVDLAQAAGTTDPEQQARRERVLQARGRNIALPAPRADGSARTVVRPSPDLLYTACVFDLAEGPLRISAPVPGSYLSISGFASDTSNFFALNDSAGVVGADGIRRIELLLSRQPVTAPASVQLVLSPSRRGVVLFRLLIPDESALPALVRDFQMAQRCEPWLGGV